MLFDIKLFRYFHCMSRKMATITNCDMPLLVKNIVPPMTSSHHKGQCGRIGILGGCKEYTGAPYFAGISALKVGADLSHIFCTSDAASVIKSYSPELIVHPVLDDSNAVAEIKQWLPRLHALVIGPGLGRDQAIFDTVKEVIEVAKQSNMILVIDADGLFLVTQTPAIITSYSKAILTPNKMEFSRLCEALQFKPTDSLTNDVCELATRLGVTIVAKGAVDIITNGKDTVTCDTGGSYRRCGGQGDLLSGSLGTFAYWGHSVQPQPPIAPSVIAGYAACFLTRECNSEAFATHKRSMTTTDMISCIGRVFHQHFETIV